MPVCRTQYDEDRDEYLLLRARARVRKHGAAAESHGRGDGFIVVIEQNPEDIPADDDLITVPDEAPPGWP